MVLSCTKHGFKVSFMISGIPKGAFRRCVVDSVTNPSLKSPGTHHTNKTQLLIQTHRTPHLLFSHHRFSLHPRDAPAAFLNITHEFRGCICPVSNQSQSCWGTRGRRPRVLRLLDTFSKIKPPSFMSETSLSLTTLSPTLLHWCCRKQSCSGDWRNKRSPACVRESPE